MLVCSLLSTNRTRDRGCSAHPAFPAPSEFWRTGSFQQSSGAMRRENNFRRPGQVSVASADLRCAIAHRGTHTPRLIGENAGFGDLLQQWLPRRMGPGVRRDDTVGWSYTINVIASAAKQSISPRKERMDCFAALSCTNAPRLLQAMTWNGLVRTSSRRNHAVNIASKWPEIRMLSGFWGVLALYFRIRSGFTAILPYRPLIP